MKRVLRDVVVSAVSAVATVGAGTGALLASSEALAQDSGAAQAPQAQASGVAIRRIVVEGNQRIEPATIRNIAHQ